MDSRQATLPLPFNRGPPRPERLHPDVEGDRKTAKTAGTYQKVNYNLSCNQALLGPASLNLSVTGQLASRNLDRSRGSLGGPYSVRGYPAGEATGDQGWVGTAELRWNFAGTWQLTTYYDHGCILLHKHGWPDRQAGNPTLENGYALSGTGLSLAFAKSNPETGDTLVNLFVAGNGVPNQGLRHRQDAENHNNSVRIWLRVVKYFRALRSATWC